MLAQLRSFVSAVAFHSCTHFFHNQAIIANFGAIRTILAQSSTFLKSLTIDYITFLVLLAGFSNFSTDFLDGDSIYQQSEHQDVLASSDCIESNGHFSANRLRW